jgi:hypothetical protein
MFFDRREAFRAPSGNPILYTIAQQLSSRVTVIDFGHFAELYDVHGSEVIVETRFSR